MAAVSLFINYLLFFITSNAALYFKICIEGDNSFYYLDVKSKSILAIAHGMYKKQIIPIR